MKKLLFVMLCLLCVSTFASTGPSVKADLKCSIADEYDSDSFVSIKDKRNKHICLDALSSAFDKEYLEDNFCFTGDTYKALKILKNKLNVLQGTDYRDNKVSAFGPRIYAGNLIRLSYTVNLKLQESTIYKCD